MADFFKQVEVILIDLWNYLYRFLCHLTKQEPNEDWIVDPGAQNPEN